MSEIPETRSETRKPTDSEARHIVFLRNFNTGFASRVFVAKIEDAVKAFEVRRKDLPDTASPPQRLVC